jgi:hypothetical protein
MAITRATTFVSTIPIKRSKFIGNTLVTINSAFNTLATELKKIVEDKIPDPLYLTYEVRDINLEPIIYDSSVIRTVAADGDRLVFDPFTLSWAPSAIPGFESSVASAWMNIIAPIGKEGDPDFPIGVRIVSSFNINKVVHIQRGEYEVYFEKPLRENSYCVIANGLYGAVKGIDDAAPIMCRRIDENKFYIKWYPGTLAYGSQIYAVVFSRGGIK